MVLANTQHWVDHMVPSAFPTRALWWLTSQEYVDTEVLASVFIPLLHIKGVENKVSVLASSRRSPQAPHLRAVGSWGLGPLHAAPPQAGSAWAARPGPLAPTTYRRSTVAGAVAASALAWGPSLPPHTRRVRLPSMVTQAGLGEGVTEAGMGCPWRPQIQMFKLPGKHTPCTCLVPPATEIQEAVEGMQVGCPQLRQR